MPTESFVYEFEQKSKGDAITKVIDTLEKLSMTNEDMARTNSRIADAADKAEAAQDQLAKTAGKLNGAMSAIKGLGIAGVFGSIAKSIYGAWQSGNEWVTQVDAMAKRMAISHESASTLAFSLRQAGLSADEAEPAISSFQGRLIDELEKQSEAEAKVADMQKERQQVLKDLASAEASHTAKIAELEAKRASIGGAEIANRIAQQDQALGKLQKDYNRFLSENRKAEEKETDRLSDVWDERVEEYKRSVLELRASLEDKERSANTAKEVIEARKAFKEKAKALKNELSADKDKHDEEKKSRIDAIRESREAEKAIMAERKAEIEQETAADIARIEEKNAKELSSLNAKIEQEKQALADSTSAQRERLAAISEAEKVAAEEGAGLTFVMEELGVKMFDAEGKMRPVNDLVWDMKDALFNMEDGAKKAAIISDLGWEDLSRWIGDGVTQTQALADAQATNNLVTEESAEKVAEQQRKMEELRLRIQGVILKFNESVDPIALFEKGMLKIAEASEVARALWDQMTTIFDLLWARFTVFAEDSGLVTAWNKIGDAIERAWENLEKLYGILTAEGGAAELLKNAGSSITSSIGGLLGFKDGGEFTVGGAGGTDSQKVQFMATPGEKVTVTPPGKSGGGSTPTFNFNAPIYGVNDLQSAIKGALQQADMGASMGAV